MPEGDTVWLTARRLNAALAGAHLISTDFRVPALATADLAGRRVNEVVSRGKHLLIRTSAPSPDAPELTVHTHLRMDGAWRVYATGERWRGGAHHHVRVVLATPTASAVGYRVHDVAVVERAHEAALVGHLGPDLLGPEWDPIEAVRRLRADPARPIGPALLDQRNLAGIGNLYKAEVLFLRGVHPDTPVRHVPDLPAMVTLAHRLLVANRTRWEQITTGSLRRGEQHWVFERAGRPCRRCGTRIEAAEQGTPPMQRLTYWCPSCQPVHTAEGPESG